jgi:hypothetical protein
LFIGSIIFFGNLWIAPTLLIPINPFLLTTDENMFWVKKIIGTD